MNEFVNTLSKYDIEKRIRRAAAYVRKSRPKPDSSHLKEEERIQKDLEMQLERISFFMENRGWEYELYKEVVSGENIQDRPQLIRLMEDVKDGQYDVVVVVDYDRLSRGSSGDAEIILTTFRDCNVPLFEESTNQLFDLNNANDVQMLKTKAFMSNAELNMINSRNMIYRRMSARKGNWVAGHAPYGYFRNKDTKKLEIDEFQGRVYREEILERFLNGEGVEKITHRLNQLKIPSPRDKRWPVSTVVKMLKSELYCGIIIYNRTMGSRYGRPSLNKQPYRIMPKERWSIVHNAHKPLKTAEEHKRVMEIFKTRSTPQAKKRFHALSGLVKCYHCGKTMMIQKEVLQNEDIKYRFSACDCEENRGGDVDLVTATIYQSVSMLEERLKNQMEINKGSQEEIDQKILTEKIDKLEKEIQKHHRAMETIEEEYEEGEYSKEKRNAKLQKREGKIADLEGEIRKLQKQLKSKSMVMDNDILQRINAFKRDMENAKEDDFDKLRKLYYSLIDHVVWTRTEDDEVEVKVNFL